MGIDNLSSSVCRLWPSPSWGYPSLGSSAERQKPEATATAGDRTDILSVRKCVERVGGATCHVTSRETEAPPAE